MHITDLKFACLDTETTGLTPTQGGRVCEVAVSISQNGKLIEEFSTLINPQTPIPANVTAIHGITDEMVKNAPVFADIAPKLSTMLDGCVVVAHNADFDMLFLRSEFENCGLKLQPLAVLDTLKMARCSKQFSSHRLGAVINEMGLDCRGWHRAMADTKMVEQVLARFLSQLENDGVNTLTRLDEFQHKNWNTIRENKKEQQMKKVVLIIRDGWGNAKAGPYNAVSNAQIPNITKYLEKYPHTQIEASGEQVGLPAGYMGSSEVGHLNMGAGRIVIQELKRLKDTIEDGSLFKSAAFSACIDNCLNNHKPLHVMGLVQDEGVHAHQDHLHAIIRYAAQKGIKEIYVHFFADGRDTPPQSSIGYIRILEEVMKEAGAGKIATIQGRYYAMDRGEDWSLTDKAYNLIVRAEGLHGTTAEAVVEEDYKTLKTPDGGPMVDEYIPPTVLGDYKGMEEGSSVIFFNFRQDRAIQLTRAFIDDDYPGKRGPRVPCVYCGLTKYYDSFPYNALPSMTDGGGMNNLLGEVISKAGLKQLRLAETQKFKHVTSFFNGKLLKPYEGEDRIEKKGRFDPATFAEHPEMEAYIVKDEAIHQIETGKYDFIVINFANCDMVGHTGNFKSVVKAVEVVDECTGAVAEAALQKDYAVFITADHGNAEEMWDAKINMPKTAHTTNLVDFIYLNNDHVEAQLRPTGNLGDIAATVLDVMGLDKPADMTATSLIVK